MEKVKTLPLEAGSQLPEPTGQRHKAILTVPMSPNQEALATIFGDAQLLIIPASLRSKETDEDYEIPQVKVTASFKVDDKSSIDRTFYASFEGQVPSKGETVLVQCTQYMNKDGIPTKTAHIIG
jgi:hypothetical protein